MNSPLQAIESKHSLVFQALDDLKAQNIVSLDVSATSSFTDVMVITTGTSRRHVSAIVDAVVLSAKSTGLTVLGVEGEKTAEWVLIDLGDMVVNVMQRTARDFYALERFWATESTPQQQAI